MGYIIIFFMILTYSTMLSILFKKRIEQVIPIGIVEIIVIIFLAGLIDDLKLGILIVQILTIIQLIIMVFSILKKIKKHEIKETINNILTPGLCIYIILFIISIIINTGRVLENYDEFNHWAVISKNMFMYDTFGNNVESIVVFNEYPPFTAIFQYLFLTTQKIYSEDIIMIVQNILYLSIIIPITRMIDWNRSIKKILLIIPIIICIPIIFYENFFLDILVDGILGIMFAYVIYSAFKEDNIFKYISILAGIIMLCLTKTSGIGLAILGIIIISIKQIIDAKNSKQLLKKEIKFLSIVIFITISLISMWYLKMNNTEKRWDFNKALEINEQKSKDAVEIFQKYSMSIFFRQTITERKFTIFSSIVLFIVLHVYMIRNVKNKKYKYYARSMLISIPIYLIFVLITYVTIFDVNEAKDLTSFERYTSTILLAYIVFQMLVLVEEKNVNFKSISIVILSIILAIIPMKNIQEKYIDGKNYIITSNINRDIYTKLKYYNSKLKTTDKLLYIAGRNQSIPYIESINNYEIMPNKIEKIMTYNFDSQEYFENEIKNFTHIFINKITEEQKEQIKSIFKDSYIRNNTLYKINNDNGKFMLEIERQEI